MGRYASLYQQFDGKGTVNALIKTPNIDRIANEGVMFTDYYAEQSCTAGRASFITGQSVMGVAGEAQVPPVGMSPSGPDQTPNHCAGRCIAWAAMVWFLSERYARSGRLRL